MLSGHEDSRKAGSSSIIRITQQLERHRLVAERVLPQQRDDLVHACPRRPVLVEQVAGKQNEVDVRVARDFKDLSEGVDRVLAPHRVLFRVTDVVVGCEKDAETASCQL